jgi:hypothetical protein
MPQAKGIKSKISCASETTFKTLGSTNPQVIPFVSETLRATKDLVSSAIIRGSRSPYMPIQGRTEVSGDITTYLTPYLGKLFYHLLGNKATAGTAAPYTHTFTVSDLPEGLSIQKGFTDINKYFVYKGCRINSLKITARPTGFIDAVFSILGATLSMHDTNQIANPIDYTLSNVGGPFSGFEASISEGGTALGICTEVDLTIENGLDGDNFVLNGTGERYAIPEGIVRVSGTVRALFESTTLLNKAINNTETNLQITFMHGTGNGTAYNEKLIIDVPELVFKPQDPVISGPAGVMLELPFEGYYQNNSDNSAVKITLINTQAAAEVA